MNSWTKLNKNESGQAALEAAIILIAFVVVASVFAFAVLSAGSASTARGQQAIYSGLNNVQSSMAIKGAVTALGTGSAVTDVVFDVALVSGGDPVDLDDTSGTPVVVIAYRDATQAVPNLAFAVTWVTHNGTTADHLLETGELAEIDVNLAKGATPLTKLKTDLGVNTPFSLEIKPPTGAVLQINSTTPAAIEPVMTLR